jgi:hypothetical protein
LDEAGVLDAMFEATGHHLILPIDESGQLVSAPEHKPCISGFGELQDKAETGIVALVLDAGEAASSALKAHAPGLAHADAIEGSIGSTRQRLSQHGLDVLGNPAHAQGFDRFVQGGFAEAIPLAQGGEGGGSLGLVGARKSTSSLPGRISSHAAQALLSFGEDGIVELASGFQVGT